MPHFGKIGTGAVVALAQEIEKEKAEREKAATEASSAAMQASASPVPAPIDEGGKVAPEGVVKGETGDNAVNGNGGKDAEGDVKMEER